MSLEPADLRLLSQLLDRHDELPDDARAEWLRGLDGPAARLRPTLLRMLAQRAAGGLPDFLAQPAGLGTGDGAYDGPSDFAPDDRVGPYRLLRPIGRGGMGEVWLAVRADGQLKRQVALKLPVRSLRRSVLVQRFERERDILGALIHPHIARLYDAGVAEDGQPYMALEYVEGTPITEAADSRALGARERVELLRQVMEAVQYAHANLVVHRDLKPANVLVTARGEARLLDFGIAKLMEQEGSTTVDSDLTRLGGRALTLRYAAPEQIAGGSIGTAADVWALGVLLYELLAGRRPFESDARGSIEQHILAHDPAPPGTHAGGVLARLPRALARELDAVVLKALKRERSERYASVGAFADDLDRWLRGEPVRAQRDSRWYRARKFVGRNRLAVGLAALAGSALVGAATVAVALGLQAREESARARAARDFMVDIFRRADPDLSNGRDVSARQLLAQGQRVVLETMEGQPMLQAELLGEIGRALESMFDLPAADEAYAHAAARHLRAGQWREAAALAVDRAALRLGSVWELPSVDGLLAQAEALHAGRPADAEFAARQAIYRGFAAELAGDDAARQSWYEQARVRAAEGLRDAGPRTVLALRMLAVAELAMNRPQPAAQRLEALLARLQSAPSALPADRLSVLVELGVAERSSGRYRAGLSRLQTARALCQSTLNPKGSQCVYNEFHRASLLLLLGLDEQALEAVPLLALPDGAADAAWGDRRAVQAFEVLGRNGRLADHPALVARVEATGRGGSAGGSWQEPLAALTAQVRQRLRDGQPRQALALSTQAQVLMASRNLADERFALPAQALHAISLHLAGRHDAALELLDRVHATQVAALGADHPDTQLASIARAGPLWALQRQPQALALVQRALPILREAMGAQAPALARIEALRDQLAAAPPGSMPSLRSAEPVL